MKPLLAPPPALCGFAFVFLGSSSVNEVGKPQGEEAHGRRNSLARRRGVWSDQAVATQNLSDKLFHLSESPCSFLKAGIEFYSFSKHLLHSYFADSVEGLRL